jgi:uncharacterized membrane protein YoaK (UPF0700 family)
MSRNKVSGNTVSGNKVTTLIAIALTFCSGAMDVASFTRLGNVFASVMTGNIVLFGLAAARGSVSLLLHTVTSVAGYVTGVAGGTLIMWYYGTLASQARSQRAGDSGDGSQAARASRHGAVEPPVRAALLAELALLAGLLTGWEIAGSRPGGLPQFCLLLAATMAMGVQSAAVSQMGLTDVSTTYLTGTLTGLVRSLVHPEHKPDGLIRPGVLLGLVCGALLSGLLVVTVPALVPMLPMAALVVVLLVSAAR